MLHYSKTTGGFYDDAIHSVIPADSVRLTADEHAALMAAQAAGKIIQAGIDGKPLAIDPPALSARQVLLSQIAASEAVITERRIREAVLGLDGGWLKTVDDKIVALRKQLA